MGHNRRYRCLGDASKYGADFVVKCRRCRREEVFAQATFIEMMAVTWTTMLLRMPDVRNLTGRAASRT